MARIEYREMPHQNARFISLKYGGETGVTVPIGATDVHLFTAKKSTWVHQITVYTDTVSTGSATIQLEAALRGVRAETTGGSVILSEAVNLQAAAGNANGEIRTSDMGLANLINDAETADYANTTDLFDMSGNGTSAVVVVDTPYELQPGASLILVVSAALTGFIGDIEILLGEDPI